MVSPFPCHNYLLSPPGGALTCPGHQPSAPGEGMAGAGPCGWGGAPCHPRVPLPLLWNYGWGVPENRAGEMGTSFSECPPSPVGGSRCPLETGGHSLPPSSMGLRRMWVFSPGGTQPHWDPYPWVSPTLGTLVAAEAPRGLVGGRGMGAGP